MNYHLIPKRVILKVVDIMCGIFGVVNYRLNEVKTPHDMNCVEAVFHRGPDEGGTFYDQHVFLGHRRLSVVDIEQGKQPMAFHHYTLVYNGELYNTEEVRAELLEAGYTFKGHSDTEVLLKAYVCFGEKVVEKLNGIYAFAVWNSQEKTLYVARDRAGVKPLYYSLLADGIIIASEQKQILQYTQKNEITLEGFQELLGVGPSHTPGHGLYKGISELKPGHYMLVEPGRIKTTKYWDLVANEHTDDFETTVEKTREILLDAIKRQLVSDVPLCTFLSGGVDSSAITAVAAGQMKNLHTFSIDYEDNLKYFKKTDFTVSQDNDFIKMMSDLNQTHHHYCVITNQDLADALANAVHLRDMPGMADVDSSLYWFCKEIKKDFILEHVPNQYNILTSDYNYLVVPDLKAFLDQHPNSSIFNQYYGGMNVTASEEEQLKIADDYSKFVNNFNRELNKEGSYVYGSNLADSSAQMSALFGGVFFIGIFLSIIFMVGTVLVIYYKQISEGYEDRERFIILQKVGLDQKQIKQTINKQVLTVFFLPLLFAFLHLAFAYHMLSLILKVIGVLDATMMLTVTLSICAIFLIVYVLIFMITSRSYRKIVQM